jgi:predicted GIY-YIG superfamily endonuclease
MTADPGRTALYRLYDEDGKLLYVGITSDPGMRFAQHKADKHWWRLVARKDIDWFDKRANAAAAEEMAIKVKDPMFNYEHSRYRPALKVSVELSEAQLAGLDMLMRVAGPRPHPDHEFARGDMLLLLLHRELESRGLMGDGRCFHAAMCWPDGVKVLAGDEGVCPCGMAIQPDGRIPADDDQAA